MTLKSVCLTLIRLYRAAALPMRPRCRFWPTCSQYAEEALETRGLREGLRLSLRRLLRCHPLGGHGFDPVPCKEI